MARYWIKKAIKHPGALRRALHVRKGKKIPLKRLKSAARHGSKLLRRRANLAITLGRMHH